MPLAYSTLLLQSLAYRIRFSPTRFVLTPSVEGTLRCLARAVASADSPVLLQGPTRCVELTYFRDVCRGNSMAKTPLASKPALFVCLEKSSVVSSIVPAAALGESKPRDSSIPCVHRRFPVEMVRWSHEEFRFAWCASFGSFLSVRAVV